MHQAEQQRGEEQGEVFTVGQVFEAPGQTTLDIAAKERFLDQRHQQQVVQ